VTFLLDSLSYSAIEDALLGLRDLAHVRFLGEPSGGGSGRPRSVLLQDGVVLSVSTALTFERSGRCVEGNGLSVDAELPADALRSGRAVDDADSSW
jgi:carboxyl-terminal processing protease